MSDIILRLMLSFSSCLLSIYMFTRVSIYLSVSYNGRVVLFIREDYVKYLLCNFSSERRVYLIFFRGLGMGKLQFSLFVVMFLLLST